MNQINVEIRIIILTNIHHHQNNMKTTTTTTIKTFHLFFSFMFSQQKFLFFKQPFQIRLCSFEMKLLKDVEVSLQSLPFSDHPGNNGNRQSKK
jgi:hypothetical protein